MREQVSTLSENDQRLRYLRMTATRASKVGNGYSKDVLDDMINGSTFRGNDWTRMGTVLEPHIIDMAASRIGSKLTKIGTVISQDLYDSERQWYWGAASGDAQFFTDAGQLVNVECKTVNHRGFVKDWGDVPSARKWDYSKDWISQVGEGSGVAKHYQYQLHWQHLVLNCAGSIVCCLTGNEVYMYLFKRDRTIEQELVAKCLPLWRTAWDAVKASK